MAETTEWPHGQDDDAPAAEPIAIIGLACRLPGAGNAAEFWRNLAAGVESVRSGPVSEQPVSSAADQEELEDPNFVPAVAVLDDAEYFDAAFFGMSAREAQVRDPQQRLFLELAYTALEDGAYDPARYDGDIGVFAGSGEDAYQWRYTRRNPAAFAAVGPIGVALGSHPDYVATLASYKLNLRGPSLTVHTACSTSLVAVHLACEALRHGECDMALGGGVNIDLPLGRGYLYVEGGVHSRDGHCRAFDARATGTVWGSGGAVVLLKRLPDALADGDHIRAVILGNAINNDGSAKVGFTAPSQEGQAVVIAQALSVANVDPRTISYVEAHGTGTALGDPIEVGALSSVFRQYSGDVAWCGIGTVKTNIGHLGAAAGIAGLVKTVLALEHRLIPATLHYETPNPKIDFGRNPFYVNTTLSQWNPGPAPRRASVSSFGMGGTNAHLILQEAPEPAPEPAAAPRPAQLIQLSARTVTALDSMSRQLAEHLAQLAGSAGDGTRLVDVAHTLRAGRPVHKERLAVAVTSLADAAAALGSPQRVITGTAAGAPAPIVLMFPGQGAQYPGMGAQLYQARSAFRDVIDECTELLREQAGIDLRDLLLGAAGDDADERLRQTRLAQPALFIIEYALALLWRGLGVAPAGMLGHSIGEYVAATLAGVFTLSDALAVVSARGELMQAIPPGAMAAVQLPLAELRSVLPGGLSVAAVNAPGSCVVSGESGQVADFGERMAAVGVAVRPLRTSHAFHSTMMEPMLAEFRAVVAGVPRRPPQRPFLSNVTGEWITAADATDPSYWVRHARDTVRFADCLATVAGDGETVLLECGPGQQLSGLARAQRRGSTLTAVTSLPARDGGTRELQDFCSAAGRLWTSGVQLDLSSLDPAGNRIPLPTYPWEREYFWVEPALDDTSLGGGRPPAAARPRVDGWFSVPAWRQLPVIAGRPVTGDWLLFADATGAPLAEALRQAGADVTVVRPGPAFRRQETGYDLRPSERADYDALLQSLAQAQRLPSRIIHAWTLDEDPAGATGAWSAQDRGFFSLLYLAQALAARQDGPCQLDVVTSGTQDVTGSDATRPEHATVAGVARVVPLELPWLSIRHLDLDPAADQALTTRPGTAERVVAELSAESPSGMIALRAGRRWTLDYEPVTVTADGGGLPPGPGVRDQGVYLITGGLGGIGITVAEDLARRTRARIVLVSRGGLPAREEWDGLLQAPPGEARISRAVAAIRRMEDHGSEVLVLAADVTSPAALREVRQQAVARFGRVDGIVHAAGVPAGGLAEVKDAAAASAVLAPKIAGTVALQEVFGDDDLDFVVLCSSATALAGGFGQVDYCAANNFLDAYASSRPPWRAQVTSVNWGSWLDVGMAAEVAAPAAFRALQRGDLMTPVEHPLITARHEGDALTVGWCSGQISPATHWVLDEHRMAGVPVLPGTGYLEAVRCAAEAIAPDREGVLELLDVVIAEPMTVADGSAAQLRVVFSRGADGLEFQVVNVGEESARVHARGTVAWARESPARQADIAGIRHRCTLAVRGEDGSVPSASGLISFGPRWGSLRQVYAGPGEELARLETTDAVADELSQWILHPALLDEATSFGTMPGDHQYLPFGYGRVTVRGPLTRRLWSHLRLRDADSSGAVVVADISIFDDHGHELVSISDYPRRRASDGPAAGGADAPANGRRAPADGGVPPTGIRPGEGAEALVRLVTADLGPRVAITARAVSEIISSAAGLTQEDIEANPSSAMRSQRGSAADGSDYVAPGSPLEEVIARVWAEALGADRISVTDDFFDLGGNSLIAVQVISLVRKETGIRLPMRSFFDAPTVSGTAAMAEELRQAADGAS